MANARRSASLSFLAALSFSISLNILSLSACASRFRLRCSWAYCDCFDTGFSCVVASCRACAILLSLSFSAASFTALSASKRLRRSSMTWCTVVLSRGGAVDVAAVEVVVSGCRPVDVAAFELMFSECPAVVIADVELVVSGCFCFGNCDRASIMALLNSSNPNPVRMCATSWPLLLTYESSGTSSIILTDERVLYDDQGRRFGDGKVCSKKSCFLRPRRYSKSDGLIIYDVDKLNRGRGQSACERVGKPYSRPTSWCARNVCSHNLLSSSSSIQSDKDQFQNVFSGLNVLITKEEASHRLRVL